MQLIPSMDLMAGRLVRLRHGDRNQATFYDFSPESWVEKVMAAGATRIHLVDLDAAFGEARQGAFVEFPKCYPSVQFQLGGGLRSREIVQEVLDLGFEAVVGTLAVEKPEALTDLKGLIAALDMKNLEVVTRGWQSASGRTNDAIFRSLLDLGIDRALVTDVGRDGTLEGPGIEATALVGKAGFQVQASGGMKAIEDFDQLRGIPNLLGAISGKALMEGHIKLEDPRVQAALRGGA
ncbi:MAG: 1-(5-phosphoribosyl)-5-[(5-phosphoribosylamino)methylideneamino]imidazole-4-carboxamide isomerase [Holophagaceae bacterium]|nr:1-(5-phosphoribosyl)-5-[(5-phosphoribosylamino)methylideneamino]imidazole-4-carboxamide isomerase [Holophagaceae bacterium]